MGNINHYNCIKDPLFKCQIDVRGYNSKCLIKQILCV